MSDNLTTQAATPATIASGVSIATDDVGGVHYQRFKLDLGGNGAADPAVGDGTNGLDVDVTRLPVMTFTESGSGTATTAAGIVDATVSRVTLVQADDDNTVDIYLGNATAQGVRLTPGASIVLPVSAADIYLKTLSGTATYRYASLN